MVAVKNCKNIPVGFIISVYNKSRTAERIFMKFGVGEFY
jgi:hypothetical protein